MLKHEITRKLTSGSSIVATHEMERATGRKRHLLMDLERDLVYVGDVIFSFTDHTGALVHMPYAHVEQVSEPERESVPSSAESSGRAMIPSRVLAPGTLSVAIRH